MGDKLINAASIPSVSLADVGDWVWKFFEFSSNFVTVVLGAAAIYAFFRYGKKLTAVLRLVRFQHLNDRWAEVNESLDLILTTTITKGRSLEVRALFGRLNGQILPLCEVIPELKDLQATIQQIAHENGRLNEPIKQQVAHQLKAVFDHTRYQALGDAAGDSR